MKLISRLIIKSSGILLFAVPHLASGLDIDGLIVRSPQPPASHIVEVTHQNGHWILGMENGIIAHSVDGQNWQSVTLSYPKSIESIIHWNGTYYAGGADSRVLLKSTDLNSWTQSSPQNYPFNSRQFFVVDDTLFAVGYSPSLVKTTDGVIWEEVPLPVEGNFEGLASNGTRLILVGTTYDEDDADADGDTQEGIILASENGITWTTQLTNVPISNSSLEDDFLSVSYINGRFVAGGKQGLLASSPDGLTWEVHDTAFESWLFGVTFYQGTYFFPGRQGVLHNTDDFTTWNPDVQTGSNQTLDDIDLANNQLIAGGRDGLVVRSTDGINWPVVNTGLREFLLNVEFGAGVYVVADANGSIWWSVNSETWNAAYTDENGNLLEGLEWDGSAFAGIDSAGFVLMSEDGQSWSRSEEPVVSSRVERLRRLNGTWWVVGANGMIAWSQDLLSWNEMTHGTHRFLDIAYGAGTYVASGITATNSEAVIYSSTDGVEWNIRDPGIAANNGPRLNTANYANGRFVVLGQSYVLLTSEDGISWSSSGVAGMNPFNSSMLRVIDGSFVAPDLNGVIWTSANGLTWNPNQTRSGRGINDIIASEDRTVAVGASGTVLSTDILELTGYAAWVRARFTQSQQEDPEFWEVDSDPDKDDQPNAVEYYSNTLPLLSNSSPPFVPILVSVDGNLYPGIEIRRRKELLDAVIILETASVFPAFEPVASSEIVEVSSESIDSETDLVRFRTSTPIGDTPSSNTFLRVGVQIQVTD